MSETHLLRDGKPVNEWAAEAAMLIGEYGRATKHGHIADQCNRVASRLLASVGDTIEVKDDLYEALKQAVDYAIEAYYGSRSVTREGDKRDKHDRRKRLVIAAAWIVAEIERLDRASGNDTKHGSSANE